MAKVGHGLLDSAAFLIFVCATFVICLFIGLQNVTQYAQEYRLSRQSSHLEASLAIAEGIVKCHSYPVRPRAAPTFTVANVDNTERFADAAHWDCSKARPDVAVDMGYSLLLALPLAVGTDTPLELAKLMLCIKILLTAIVALFLFFSGLQLQALVFTLVLMPSVVILQKQFFSQSMLIVNHNYNWVVFVCCLGLIAVALERLTWATTLLSGASLGFASLFRFNDFLSLVICLALIELMIFLPIRKKNRARSKTFLTGAAILIAGFSLNALHTRMISWRGATGTARHAVMHPIILGLGDPETPFSKKYGFAWGADSETLKVAQAQNPEIKTLYTPAFSEALLEVYLREWRQNPTMMIESYWIKASGILDHRAYLYIVPVLGAIIGLLWGDTLLLIFSLAFAIKIFETVIIFSSQYDPMYHQYVPVLSALIIIQIAAASIFRLLRWRRVTPSQQFVTKPLQKSCDP